ncbi:MAG: hypothetical protein GC160_01175 [Acidobacteria bacterium]|nr:hypothetical protein [Acidobacteriota bacterium]
MKARTSRRHEPTRGSSLIETAFVLPIAILLCLGAWDFSRLYISAADLEAAATVAAVQGARAPEDLAAARSLALKDLDPDGEVSLEPVCACPSAPSAWAACEQIACGAESPRRYIRAVASSSYFTFGRYPGIESPARLERERFVRVE